MVGFASLLIASANAQEVAAGATPPEASPLASLFPFLLILVLFYILMVRPQSKRFKEHAEMVKNLKRGDKIVTGGGIIGKVVKSDATSETVQVEIAPNVTVEVSRATITSLVDAMPKKTTAPAAKGKKSAPAQSEKENIANDN